tara:strand:- start:832 stop:1023 length:192 start_codon:yes stop_codon:yes gene_type:complete
MLENRRDRRNKKNNKVPAVKNSITKKDKIIWIGILIVVFLLICFALFLKFIEIFVPNDLMDKH